MYLDLIIKSSDESYFYLFKLLNKYKYSDIINSDINNLVLNKTDNLGYIKDSLINIEEVLKKYKINKVFIEEETMYLAKLFKKYNIKYVVFNSSNYYKKELNKLKGIILLKYILEENQNSIYNLNFLILGDNDLSNEIKHILSPLATYDTYNKDIINLNLTKYDVIISTSNLEISPEVLFNVKKNLIIYDLEVNSKIDRLILKNNYIKYRFISNVSLYLPMAKAKLMYEVMCDNESL